MFARVERTWRQQICPYEVVAGEAVKGVNSIQGACQWGLNVQSPLHTVHPF